MIRRFSDHAANERTYLAWIRTGISIMALGFLVEKLDLFVAVTKMKVAGSDHLNVSQSAEWVGLGLLLVATIILGVSTARFLRYRQSIDLEDSQSYGDPRGEVLLGFLLTLVGVFLIIWLGHNLLF